MKQTISKLGNFKIAESFIQVNFLKGFKYIDTVGEVLNIYQKKDGAIEYNMSPDRLIINAPTNNISSLKISINDLWCHFVEPTTLTSVKDSYVKEANKIIKINGVEEFNRIGWRLYLILDLKEDRDNFNGLVTLPNANVSNLNFDIVPIGDVKANMAVKLLQKKEDKKSAVFFDLDLYLDKSVSKDTLSSSLHKIKTAAEDSRIISLINEILAEL